MRLYDLSLVPCRIRTSRSEAEGRRDVNNVDNTGRVMVMVMAHACVDVAVRVVNACGTLQLYSKGLKCQKLF